MACGAALVCAMRWAAPASGVRVERADRRRGRRWPWGLFGKEGRGERNRPVEEKNIPPVVVTCIRRHGHGPAEIRRIPNERDRAALLSTSEARPVGAGAIGRKSRRTGSERKQEYRKQTRGREGKAAEKRPRRRPPDGSEWAARSKFSTPCIQIPRAAAEGRTAASAPTDSFQAARRIGVGGAIEIQHALYSNSTSRGRRMDGGVSSAKSAESSGAVNDSLSVR